MKPGSPVRIDISVVKSSPTVGKDKDRVSKIQRFNNG